MQQPVLPCSYQVSFAAQAGISAQLLHTLLHAQACMLDVLCSSACTAYCSLSVPPISDSASLRCRCLALPTLQYSMQAWTTAPSSAPDQDLLQRNKHQQHSASHSASARLRLLKFGWFEGVPWGTWRPGRAQCKSWSSNASVAAKYRLLIAAAAACNWPLMLSTHALNNSSLTQVSHNTRCMVLFVAGQHARSFLPRVLVLGGRILPKSASVGGTSCRCWLSATASAWSARQEVSAACKNCSS